MFHENGEVDVGYINRRKAAMRNNQMFKDGWNFRIDGKGKLPKYSKATADFHEGYDCCNAMYSHANYTSVRNKTEPVYPDKM